MSWRVLSVLVAVAFGLVMASAQSSPTALMHSPQAQVLEMMDAQLALAKSCTGSVYASSCPPASIMLFVQTMYGACTPVGCVHTEGKMEPDRDTAVMEAVRQSAAGLAVEESSISLGLHYVADAMTFQQGELDNKFLVRTLLKKHPDSRDIPALRFAVEEALFKGYAHSDLGKAMDVLAWRSSPVEVVTNDQLAALSSGKCQPSASACPQGSVAIVTSKGRGGGCDVVACVHVAGGEADDRALVKKAMQQTFPWLPLAPDLRSFEKTLGDLAKTRKERAKRCFEVIRGLLEGEQGCSDYGAINFFVHLADHEGFTGNEIAEARSRLAQHAILMLARDTPRKLWIAASKAALKAKVKEHTRATERRAQNDKIVELQESQATLEESLEASRLSIKASSKREGVLLEAKDMLRAQLRVMTEENSAAEVALGKSREREEALRKRQAALEAELEERQQVNIAAEAALVTAREQIEVLLTKGVALESDLEASVRSRNAFESLVEAAETHIGVLRGDLESKDDQLKRGARREKELMADIVRLKEEIEKSSRIVASCEYREEALAASLKSCDTSMVSCEADLVAEKDATRSCNRQLATACLKIGRNEQELAFAQQKIATAERIARAAEERCEFLEGGGRGDEVGDEGQCVDDGQATTPEPR